MEDTPIPNLRSKTGHPLWTLLAASGISITVAWGMVKWAATTPTREEFEHMRTKLEQVQLDQAVQKGSMERTSQDMAQIRSDVSEMRKSMEARRR